MRGGAIVFAVWGTLLATLMAVNWIWEGKAVHVASFGFAVLVVYLSGLYLLARRREAIRKGPPEYEAEPDALPRASLAAAGAGISIALMLFGVVFGSFLILIGAGLLLACLGRLARELYWQRQQLRSVREPLP